MVNLKNIWDYNQKFVCGLDILLQFLQSGFFMQLGAVTFEQ